MIKSEVLTGLLYTTDINRQGIIMTLHKQQHYHLSVKYNSNALAQ